ncbi:hypothetical protein FDECE_4265 [Fusarium decemcellulare]|nr:hypothetical protein FDECE_4265 [Fusarium decemcellulare]
MQSQPKRMRLGTKSCTECRRRKVRCTFNEGQDKCRQCTLHKTTCKPQQDSPNPPDGPPDNVQLRLGNIEESVRILVQSLGQTPGKLGWSPAGIRGSPFGASSSEASSRDEDWDASGALDEAPLVQFLRDTLAAQSRKFQTDIRPHPSERTGVLPVQPIQHLIPDTPALVSILQYTQPFWSIWPLAWTVTATGEFCFPQDVPSAVRFVQESLQSTEPGVVAKCLVWFCICLQELPKNFDNQHKLRLPLSPSDLILNYIDHIDTLLQTNSSPAYNLDFLEALTVQYELFIFMGRPCRAWKSTRTALDNAMLLGLHRPGQSRRRKEIWDTLWVQERHLSLFLGLPYSVPEHLLHSITDDESAQLEKRILQRVAIISGHITERDRLQQQSSYSTTVRIMEEMDQLRALIPIEWWNPGDADPNMPFGQAFTRRAIILFYFTTNKMLHLPYVRMAAQDKRYAYSRDAAFESAEGMVRAYQNMRVLGDKPMSCDFLDFVAFSGATILAADLVSQGSLRSVEEEQRLWTLTTGLAGDMRKTAEVLDCPVASQSADVLEYLHAARHGTYVGPEQYEATIPYFGRMRIRKPKERAQPGVQQQQQSLGFSPSVIELESNVFNFRMPSEFQTAYELTEDWTVGMDFDCNYDWQGVFEFTGVGS